MILTSWGLHVGSITRKQRLQKIKLIDAKSILGKEAATTNGKCFHGGNTCYVALLLKVASYQKNSSSPESILKTPNLKSNTCLTEPKSEF